MPDYVINLESPVSLREKLVRVYMENGGTYRQISRKVPIGVDVSSYVNQNFDSLWNGGNVLAEDAFISASEQEFDTLYREVARAAIRAARVQNNDLTDVVAAMEVVISGSDKAGAYTRLKSLANNATAAQRDAFFVVIALMVLGRASSD